MEPGFIPPIMDMYGYQMSLQDLCHIPRTDTGSSPMRDGHGFLIIRGDGRLFITDAGIPMSITAPCGYRIMNGVRGGLPGGDQKAFMDGLRSDRASASI